MTREELLAIVSRGEDSGRSDDREGCLFTATIHRTPIASSVKSSVESSVKTNVRILELLSASSGMTMADLAEVVGLSKRAVEKQVAKLRREGRLRRVGSRKAGHWEVVREVK
jgi:ATP-dependent DNA helicase RecG